MKVGVGWVGWSGEGGLILLLQRGGCVREERVLLKTPPRLKISRYEMKMEALSVMSKCSWTRKCTHTHPLTHTYTHSGTVAFSLSLFVIHTHTRSSNLPFIYNFNLAKVVLKNEFFSRF